MIFESKFSIGDILYLKTDRNQEKRMLVSISFRVTGPLYELAFGGGSSWHYEFEITEKEDILTKTTN
jgi:hypothetical protein